MPLLDCKDSLCLFLDCKDSKETRVSNLQVVPGNFLGLQLISRHSGKMGCFRMWTPKPNSTETPPPKCFGISQFQKCLPNPTLLRLHPPNVLVFPNSNLELVTLKIRQSLWATFLMWAETWQKITKPQKQVCSSKKNQLVFVFSNI